MLLRPLFFAFVILALLGDLRIFLYALNRFIFGNHEKERSPWQWLMYVLPPLLVVLTALFWPLGSWIDRLMSSGIAERVVPARIEELQWSLMLAKVGATWLIIAAAVCGVFALWHLLTMFAPGGPDGIDLSPTVGAWIGLLGWIALAAGQFLTQPVGTKR